MKVSQAAIKRLVQTGAAIDVTNADINCRPFNSTVIFHSTGKYGLNGIVIRLDDTGVLWAVTARSTNLFILAQ